MAAPSSFAQIGHKNGTTFVPDALRAQDVWATTGISAEEHITNADIHVDATEKALLTNAGSANGVATLGADGKVPESQLDLSETGGNIFDLSERVDDIEELIPTQATAENQLSDKNFVNSSINSLAANFIASDANNTNFATYAALSNAETFYHAGAVFVPEKSDYAVVLADENNNGAQVRYINVSETTTPSWQLQYVINDAPFTSAQNSAIDSGITAALTAKISTNETAAENAQTTATNAAGAAATAQSAAETAQTTANLLDFAYCEDESDMNEKNLRDGAFVLMAVTNTAG
jgi:hypothetical protein